LVHGFSVQFQVAWAEHHGRGNIVGRRTPERLSHGREKGQNREGEERRKGPGTRNPQGPSLSGLIPPGKS
jgi:hypothetical protein